MSRICEFCGSENIRQCEFIDAMGSCPWDEQGGFDEPDPDHLREDRDECRRLEEDDR